MWLNSLLWGATALTLACVGVQAAPATECLQPFKFDFNDPSELSHFKIDEGGLATVENGNLKMALTKQNTATTLNLTQTIPQGYVRARIKAGPGNGVVTAFTMRGANGDEIDHEWLGKKPGRVETTFFVGGKHISGFEDSYNFDLPNGDATAEFFNYAFEFTQKEVKYYVNDKLEYTLKNKGDGNFPLKPDHMLIGIWDGSSVSEWAGKTDYSKVSEYATYFDWIEVVPYCDGVPPATTSFSTVTAGATSTSSSSTSDLPSSSSTMSQSDSAGELSSTQNPTVTDDDEPTVTTVTSSYVYTSSYETDVNGVPMTSTSMVTTETTYATTIAEQPEPGETVIVTTSVPEQVTTTTSTYTYTTTYVTTINGVPTTTSSVATATTTYQVTNPGGIQTHTGIITYVSIPPVVTTVDCDPTTITETPSTSIVPQPTPTHTKPRKCRPKHKKHKPGKCHRRFPVQTP
ncbi:transglycosylase [Dimargaris verticillata]|uniref:Transglycosylase n=1 Tax=Dimargaris verticillata TaxID=2761393 RepID=A0A9W8EFN4_9FUNG|nr:transglycosylase [Dimargaris verticillata]